MFYRPLHLLFAVSSLNVEVMSEAGVYSCCHAFSAYGGIFLAMMESIPPGTVSSSKPLSCFCQIVYHSTVRETDTTRTIFLLLESSTGCVHRSCPSFPPFLSDFIFHFVCRPALHLCEVWELLEAYFGSFPIMFCKQPSSNAINSQIITFFALILWSHCAHDISNSQQFSGQNI